MKITINYFVIFISFFILSCSKSSQDDGNGKVGSIKCDSVKVNGIFRKGIEPLNATVTVPYTGGVIGQNDLVVSSTGVLGLVATSYDYIVQGDGIKTFKITGTPTSVGNAKFDIKIGDKSCSFSINITDLKPTDYFIKYTLNNKDKILVDTTCSQSTANLQQLACGTIAGIGTQTIALGFKGDTIDIDELNSILDKKIPLHHTSIANRHASIYIYPGVSGPDISQQEKNPYPEYYLIVKSIEPAGEKILPSGELVKYFVLSGEFNATVGFREYPISNGSFRFLYQSRNARR